MSYRFVASTLVHGFITLCAQYGINPDAVSRRAGLHPQQLTDPQAVYTVTQLDAMVVAMQEERRDPAFAIHLGERLPVDLLQIVGSLVVTAPTLRDALAQFVRYRQLVHPMGELLLREDDRQAQIMFRITPEDEISGRFHYVELYAAAILRIAGSMVQREIKVYRAELQYDASAYRDELVRVLGTQDIVFNAPENLIAFERDVLDEPLPGHFPEYHRQIEQLAARRLAELPAADTMSAAVLRFLEEQVGRRVVGMEDAAKHLGVTLRTLQRRLQEENTTYAALRDSIRFRYAQKYLRDPGMDMESIAASLGFSETANFYPAFKRWSGMSPGEFRRRAAAEAQPPARTD